MAKKDLFHMLAEETAGVVASDLKPVDYWIDSGNLAVNWACSDRFMGGGFPGGKITEMFGPSASGKTLWGTNALRGCQVLDGIPCFLDCENSFNPEWAAISSHVDIDQIVRYAPEHLEGAFLKMKNVIRLVNEKYGNSKPLLFVYDGFSVSPPKKAFEEIDLVDKSKKGAKYKEITELSKEQPGERAKVISRELSIIHPLFEKSNTSGLFLNQIRHKIGVLYGSPETTPGGKAMEFYASCRLRSSVHKKFEDKLGNTIGVNLKIKNVKNRHCAPFREVEDIELFFQQGVNPISGLLGALLKAKRITGGAGGNYVIAPEYTNGVERKFKTSKEKGMPVEVLCDYPALVDAKDPTEILDYFALFDLAIAQSMSDDKVEKDVSNAFFDDEKEIDDFYKSKDE